MRTMTTMIKVTIQTDNSICTVEEKDQSEGLENVLRVVDQAIRGVGFCPSSYNLGYDEPEGSPNDC